MSDNVSRSNPASGDVSGWAVGFTVFAAIMMIMVGVWQALTGQVVASNSYR